MGRQKKILYIQYANPAYYPPLEHSAKIFLESGYEVVFLGTHSVPVNELDFITHPKITVKLLPYCSPGFTQKLHFLFFCCLALGQAIFLRPSWIYLSDFMSTPIGMALSLGSYSRLIYHEHDFPTGVPENMFMKFIARARYGLIRRARLCIFPNSERQHYVVKTTGRTGQVACVWNCPSRDEVQPQKASFYDSTDPLILYYHGSITPERLPLTVVNAVARFKGRVHLWIAGYETLGAPGYAAEIKARFQKHDLKDCLKVLGAIPQRKNLILQMSGAHVGLSFMPRDTKDINMLHMAGASNKPFDYLAGGLVLLVSNIPEWEAAYVKPGYGRSCEPHSEVSVAQQLQWFLDHPDSVRKMGAAGRDKVLSEWNYEKQFEGVLKVLEAGNAP